MKIKRLSAIKVMLLLSTIMPVSTEILKASEFNSGTCQQCHDQNGHGFLPTIPVLKGQNTAYLIQQITNFNKGIRKHPQLNAETLKKTNADQVKVLASYFSGFGTQAQDQQLIDKPSSHLEVHADSFLSLIKQGKSLYSPCSGCHGVHAEGISPYPRLADQRPDYLKQQLLHFRNSARKSVIMQMVAVNLSDKEINALAMYLSTINNQKIHAQR